MIHDADYWTKRYLEKNTQWDAGVITTPLKNYIDQLENRYLKILIPGCGNAHEAAYLYQEGFNDVYVVDISRIPLDNFSRVHPSFPKENLIQGDFFHLKGSFDLILEQTFFCALHPSQRFAYAQKMHELLRSGGKLVGVLFEDELFTDHPPYGGFRAEYKTYFDPFFEFNVFDRCYNSIEPRENRELFINLLKKR
ncbi:MAG: methyltransferase domain-containing protein [Bacteroidota bacterium]